MTESIAERCMNLVRVLDNYHFSTCQRRVLDIMFRAAEAELYERASGRPMIAKLLLGGAIAAAAISAAAPASANPDNPFSHLWMDGQCSTSAPPTTCHRGISYVQAGIQDGSNDMQSALSPDLPPS